MSRLADRIRASGLSVTPQEIHVSDEDLRWREDDGGELRGVTDEADLARLRELAKKVEPEERETFIAFFIAQLRRDEEAKRRSARAAGWREFLEKLDRAVVIAADNVWDYCSDDSRSGTRWRMEELPNVAPPFPVFFIEASTRRCRPEIARAFATACVQPEGPTAVGFLFEAFEPDWPKYEKAWEEARREVMGLPKPVESFTYECARRFFAAVGSDAEARVVEDVLSSREISRRVSSEGEAKEEGLPRWVMRVTTVAEFAGPKAIFNVSGCDIFVDGSGRGESHGFSRRGFLPGEVEELRRKLVEAGRWDASTPIDEEEMGSIMGSEEHADVIGPDFGHLVWEAVYPAMLTLAFMHTKNVTVEEMEPPEKLSKAHKKRRGYPLVTYRTLHIEPIQRILKAEGNAESGGIRQAVHICRGHFKTFSAKGLFGKHKGTYWWPATTRGAGSRVVMKEYDVGPVDDDKTEH